VGEGGEEREGEGGTGWSGECAFEALMFLGTVLRYYSHYVFIYLLLLPAELYNGSARAQKQANANPHLAQAVRGL
jgi:hypothetical protein